MPISNQPLVPRSETTEESAEPIRLVLIEPRNLLAAGVRELLDRESDIEVLAQVATADEALPIVDEAAPDVVLVSAPIPDPTETEATRQLRHETPDAAYVVLGGP